MPCYQVQRLTLELTAANETLLGAALTALGFVKHRTLNRWQYSGITVDMDARTVTAPERTAADATNLIKRAYSAEVIKAAAAKQRWTLTPGKTDGTFVAQKRF